MDSNLVLTIRTTDSSYVAPPVHHASHTADHGQPRAHRGELTELGIRLRRSWRRWYSGQAVCVSLSLRDGVRAKTRLGIVTHTASRPRKRNATQTAQHRPTRARRTYTTTRVHESPTIAVHVVVDVPVYRLQVPSRSHPCRGAETASHGLADHAWRDSAVARGQGVRRPCLQVVRVPQVLSW